MKKRISFLLALILVLAVMVPAIPVSAAENGVASMTELYDGGVFNSTLYNTSTKFTISSVEEFELFYNAMYGGGGEFPTSENRETFVDKTVTLETDIILNDTTADGWYSNPQAKKFLQYSDYGQGPYAYFCGDFDGQGHSIKGLIIDGGNGWDYMSSVSLFSGVKRAVLKNFTVDGFYITANGASTVSVIAARASSGCEMSGITIKNGSIIAENCSMANKNSDPNSWLNQSGVGALFGFVIMESNVSDGSRPTGFAKRMVISNCVVEDSVNITATGHIDDTIGDIPVGGIGGYVYVNDTIPESGIDVSASKIQPNGSNDADVTLKPLGMVRYGMNPRLTWTLNFAVKNDGTSYNNVVAMKNENAPQEFYTDEVNDKLLASGCYGSRYQNVPSYEIKWIVDGKETVQTYNKGATPSYPGSTDKASTDTKIYEFEGWSPEIAQVNGPATYTAQYREYNRIKITWVVDGVETVEYYKEHDIPVPKVDTDKAQDEDYVYTFEGWDKTIATATEDATYTAVYSKLAKCEVTWIVDGKEIKEMYLEGAVPAYKGKPEKEEDADYTYKFKGWDVQPSALTGDATYTAQFEAKAKNPAAEEEENAGGCKGTVSAGLVTVMVVGMAGAFLSRKKDD